jgi:regulator of RNase E activity RraA
MAMPAASGGDPLIQAYLGLSTSNVSDALDRLHLAGAPHGLRPLWPGCPKIAGRAVTMKLVAEGEASPVLGTLAAIGAARPGDVLVIDHGGRTDVNSWGGIATFTAARRGLAGVVIDGVTRDIDEIQSLSFPAYGRGVIQQSIRGRCAFGGWGVDVQLTGVATRSGDLVMGDDNGIVVVPRECLVDVLRVAEHSAGVEERIKGWIAEGMDPVEAHERARYDETAAPGRSRGTPA